MAPRQPPENPDDDRQSDLLRAVHRALNDAVPVNAPVEEQPLTEMQQDLPGTRIRGRDASRNRPHRGLHEGPTAFTA